MLSPAAGLLKERARFDASLRTPEYSPLRLIKKYEPNADC